MNMRRFRENALARDESKSLLSELVDRSVEFRCDTCNHLLGKGQLGEGSVFETKCPKCGSMVRLAVARNRSKFEEQKDVIGTPLGVAVSM